MLARDDNVGARLRLIAAQRAARLQQKRELLHDGIERHLVIKKERNGRRNETEEGTKRKKERRNERK